MREFDVAKLLIAEDDMGVRLLVERALRLEGHEVVAVEDGELALEVLEQHEGRFDLLLSDIRMPAMTGIELAHAAAASEWLNKQAISGEINENEWHSVIGYPSRHDEYLESQAS